MFAASKTASVSGGYQISRSLRFNRPDSAYLSRTPASAGNRKAWTMSFWVKRCDIVNRQILLEQFLSASDTGYCSIEFASDAAAPTLVVGGYNTTWRVTTQVFRDVSAWYHIVVAVDTTQATANNRVRIYLNGSEITSFSTLNNPTQNADTGANSTGPAGIGSATSGGTYLNGYMTEIYMVDGQQLTPSSFGETNAQTGVWQPKAYSGSYGTNGFYLNFSDNSNTTAATLGKDYSGNGNNWTPNGFLVSAGVNNDSLVDSPTSYGTDTGVGGTVRGNYATFNVLASPQLAGQYVISNGNLDITPTGASSTFNSYAPATIALPSSDKYYFEYTCTNADGGQRRDAIGLAQTTASGIWLGNTGSIGYDCFEGKVNNNGSNIATYASWDNGDIVSVAVDCATGYVWFAKNGTWQAGSPSAGTGATATLSNISTYAFAIGTRAASSAGFTVKGSVNFGQRPFAYTAPSGFKALCTQNLPTPTIGATTATQANTFFTPNVYAGNNGTQTVTNSIDTTNGGGLVWFKNRTSALTNYLINSGSGYTKYLASNNTDAEGTFDFGFTPSTTGFSFTQSSATLNATGSNYVAWQWKANGSGSTNTAGSITSTVSANTTSGFSIATYTGNGSAATIGHGLGVAPSMYIVKNRGGTADEWVIYHSSLPSAAYYLTFTTGSQNSNNVVFNSTAPTSTVFSVGTSRSVNATTYVAYCFAEVAGYSKFGSYTGNGSADGPFVFTGMKPSFILYKRSDTTGNSWRITDSTRSTYNLDDTAFLYPDAVSIENDSANDALDILSNGFKIRTANAPSNASGSTYIFMAFASNPFKYSLAR